MKTIRFFVTLAIVGALGAGLYQTAITPFYSPCGTPTTYRIAAVDPKFNISNEEFIQDTQQAAQIWNDAEHKNLLQYDPTKGTVAVSLIFDQRQQLSNEINQQENQVGSEKGTIDDQIAQFQQDKATFEQKVNDLNTQIQDWNSKGGAPPDVYNQLIAQQRTLKDEETQLNQRAQQLNQSTVSYNQQISQLDNTIDTFNASLVQKPEEGLYNGGNQTITIYFDNNQDELIHTLAHELGHSLGLGHNGNQDSIMYPYSTQVTTPSSNDLSDLSVICKKRSAAELLQTRWRILMQSIQQKYFSNIKN